MYFHKWRHQLNTRLILRRRLPIAIRLHSRDTTKGLKQVTDITILEFVTYFSRHPEISRDIHLKGSADWCQMNGMDYDYFMKLETVDTD